MHRAALTYISSTTQNTTLGLLWLQEAASATDQQITRNVVQDTAETAYYEYVKYLLEEFTPHHRRLYDAIDRLVQEQDHQVTTGTIYDEYHEQCETAGVPPLSERRISDFLTHLELLALIEVTYHYGGPKGKTREIRLVDWRG